MCKTRVADASKGGRSTRKATSALLCALVLVWTPGFHSAGLDKESAFDDPLGIQNPYGVIFNRSAEAPVGLSEVFLDVTHAFVLLAGLAMAISLVHFAWTLGL